MATARAGTKVRGSDARPTEAVTRDSHWGDPVPGAAAVRTSRPAARPAPHACAHLTTSKRVCR